MGRPRNKVPSYLHHRPTKQARVRIGGRDIYLGKYDSKESKELYARLIAEHFGNGERPAIILRKGDMLTIAVLVVKYDDHALKYYEKNGKPTSQVERIRVAVRPLVKLYGSMPAAEFSPKKLKAVRSQIVKTGSLRKGKDKKRLMTPLSRGYVNALMKCIKRMFKWAIEEELVPVQVYHALLAVENLRKGRSPGVQEPRPIKPVPEKHILPVLEVAPLHIRTMIEVQLLTGMRPDEVTIMRPQDIRRLPEVWEYRPDSHKTEHHEIEKVVLIGPKAQQLLIPWLERDPSKYLFSPKDHMDGHYASRRKNRKTPMTPSQANRRRRRKPLRTPREHYDDGSYRQAVESACKKAGVPKWTPGQLRHNAGTCIRAKFGIEAAQVVLGHQNISATEIYAEKDRMLCAEIMLQLG